MTNTFLFSRSRLENSIFIKIVSTTLILFFILSTPLSVLAQEASGEAVEVSVSNDVSIETPNTPAETSSSQVFDSIVPFPTDIPDTEIESTPVDIITDPTPEIDSIMLTDESQKEESIDSEEKLIDEEIEPEAMMIGSSNPGPGDVHANDERKSIGNEILFHPDPISGSLNYLYQISLPPGRGKLTPELNLIYSSQPSNNSNILGYGWSTSIPSIQRINRTGADDMYSQDYFYSSFDGELASTSVTTYGALSENGNFFKYSYSATTSSWTVTDKSGTTYKFGTSTASRQDNPSDSTKIYQWMLSEIRDTNNNYIQFTYYKNSGQIYPDRVIYTGNDTTDGIFEADFIRESRSDIITSYQSGFGIKSNYRISRIDVKVNGTWVKKYAISYTSGDNQQRSLINTITLQGQDDLSNTITLPATTFSYQRSIYGFTATSTNWYSPLVLVDYNSTTADPGTRVADFNGDGLQDLIQNFRNTDASTSTQAYINNGNGWTLNSAWEPPLYFVDYLGGGNGDKGVRVTDINGDGLPDIIQSFQTAGGATTTVVYLNNGNGWSVDTSWNVPLYFEDFLGGGNGDKGVRFIDINGDGLPDILQSFRTAGGATSTSAYINNGRGWTLDSAWSTPLYLVDYFGGGNGDVGVRTVDINGDGLPDMIQDFRNAGLVVATSTYINTGNGWTVDTSWSFPLYLIDYAVGGNGDVGVRMVDINNDGLVDFIQSTDIGGVSSSVYLNTGSGWALDSSWVVPTAFINVYGATGYQDIDVNGDNMIDFVQHSRFIGSVSASSTATNNSKKVDLLTVITNPIGGTLTYTYRPSTWYTSGGVLSNPDLPLVLDTVNTFAISDGLGTIATTTYDYFGGNYYFSTSIDRKLSGFSKIKTTDNMANYNNAFYHIGNGTDTSHGQYSDSKYKIGKLYRTENYDSSSNLFTKNITLWHQSSLGNNRNFVFASTTLSSQYNGNSSHKDIGSRYLYEDVYGNQIQNIFYGEVIGNDDGTFSDTGTDISSTTITYATNVTPYIVGLPSDEVTQDQSLNKVRQTRHYYDGLSLGSVDKGNETKTEFWIIASNYASTTKTYDGTYGLVTQSRDPKYNLTTYTLDSHNLYPATTTNALSHAIGNVYDYATGKVKFTYDANNRVYTTTYDALRRPLTVNIPNPSTGILVTKTSYTYTNSSTPGSTSVQQTDNLSSATSTDTHIYFDGLGRNLQQRKEAEGTNTYSIKDWTYNNLGVLNSESLPYFASSTSRSSATSTSDLFVTYTYDALQRISKISNAVGSTTSVYDNWHTTITDPRGVPKDFYKDAYGNLTSVVEHNGSVHATTTYTYDLNQKLTSITDGASNIRNFTYDGLSRRLTAQDLHASGDGTYGSYAYTYDDASNMTQKVDPKSQTINYTYDALNRPLTEDYTGSGGTETTYTYDNGTDGKGRLTTASSTGALISNTYNALGGTKISTTTIAGVSYTTQYDYDRLGNQTNITYPDFSQVSYLHNSAGLLESIARKENGGSFANLINSLDYSPTGEVTVKNFVNGVQTRNTYNQNALYRLTNKVTVLPNSSHAQDLAYTYDAVGNITQVVDTSNSATAKTINYTYDSLNRLTIASTTSATTTPYRYAWTYDVLGNITAQNNGSATTTYTYAGTGYANPHAVTTMWQATSTYDANGNVTQVVGNGSPDWYQTWSYRKSITIDHTKVSGTSTLTNFPILFSTTDADLKYTSFGGKMGKSDGTDIVFTSSDGITKLDHEIEKYASTTGETVNWVEIPSLSTTTDTVIYIYFGNASASDQSNKTGVWGSSYKAVYHLPNGVTLGGLDSTSHANDMNTTGTPTAQTGKIGGGVGVSSGNYLSKTIDTTIGTTNTVSAWVYGDSFGDQAHSVNVAGGAELLTAHDPDAGKNTIYGSGFVLGTQFSTSTWYYVVTTRDGTTTNGYRSYVNGSLDITTTRPSSDSGTSLKIGTSGTYPWDGKIDEVRVSNSVHSPGWIATEYNNQSSASTFYTTGSLEVALGGNDFYTWDYANRLSEAGNGIATSTYAYDDKGQRVKMVTPSVTTYYPNKYMSKANSTTTDYVFIGDTIIAEVESVTTGGSSTSTPAFVQSKKDSTSGVATFDSSVTTGNIVVVGLTTWNSSIPSNAITDNKGNTYVKITEAQNGQDRVAIFYAKNVTGESSFTVTSSVSTDATISIHEYSGVSITSPLDTSAGLTGTSATVRSGNITTGLAGELYVGVAWSNGHDNTWTAMGGYTKREEETNNSTKERHASEDQIIFVATTTQGLFSTSASEPYAMVVASFYPATTSSAVSIATTIRYLHQDHLNSTNITTDISGNVVQTLDYYPYGGTRVNQSIDGSNERRQYIGQFTDPETNLSYLNARYYSGITDKFISEDPMFWMIPQDILIDPQQQNSYSYARGNPASQSDPTGLLTFIIPGTGYDEKVWSEKGSASSFISSVGKTFNETPLVINDKSIWSGSDTDAARQSAAGIIATQINKYKLSDGEKLNIVGHSHGGNVANLITEQIKRAVDNLITLGTPVRSDYQPNMDMVKNHVNAYSNIDLVQASGGNSGYSIIGGILFGVRGIDWGSRISGPEFGPAGRTFEGANNMNVTKQSLGINPLGVHSSYWTDSGIWSKVESQIK